MNTVWCVDIYPERFTVPYTIGIFDNRELAFEIVKSKVQEIMEEEGMDTEFIDSEIECLYECGDSYRAQIYPFTLNKVYDYK